MKILSRIVFAAVALAAAAGATGAANAGVLGAVAVLKTAPIISIANPTVRADVFRTYITKSCLATYDPAPGAPNHFMATKICVAPSSAPDGSSCTCPVVVNGRSIPAHGTVHTDTIGGTGPVVR